VEEQHVAPVAPEPVVQPEPSPVPQPPAPLPAVAQQVPTQQPTQQSAPVQSSPTASTLSAINLYQQQPPVSQQQQSLPHQVTSTGSHSQLPSQAISAGLGSFGSHQSPAPGLNIASHQQPQLHQPQSVLPQHLQHQTSTQSQAQQQTPQHLGYPSSHQLPHLDTTASTQTPLSHPAVAAQNQYFRQESPYYHVPTPPHSQSAIPQTTQDHSLSHSSPYGAFSPLGQQGQGSHLGAFGSSPAPGDYGSYGDSQRVCGCLLLRRIRLLTSLLHRTSIIHMAKVLASEVAVSLETKMPRRLGLRVPTKQVQVLVNNPPVLGKTKHRSQLHHNRRSNSNSSNSQP